MTPSDGTGTVQDRGQSQIDDRPTISDDGDGGFDGGSANGPWGRNGRPRGRVTPRSRWRLIILQVLVVSLVLTLFGRLTWLQMTGGGQAAAAVDSRIRDIAVPAPRGLIVDQAGRVLVGNRPATDVLVDRAVLSAQPDGGAATIAQISAMTWAPEDSIRSKMLACGTEGAGPDCFVGGPYEPVPVVEDTKVEAVMDLVENPDRYPGVTVRTRSVRDYQTQTGVNAAQLLGYLGRPTQDEVQADSTLHGDSTVGRGGVEGSYDAQLRGKDGIQQLSLDRTGITGTVVSESAPVAGNTVVSSVDANLQAIVEKTLADSVQLARSRGYAADSAAGVVMDVTNGQILAMASLPTYDRAVFNGGLSTEEYAALTADDGEQPLLDRVIQSQIAPASTFKVVTTAAAGRAGFDFDAKYPCPSAYTTGNKSFTNYESSAYGNITIEQALVVSCNTVFYKLADQMYAADGGVDPQGTPQELVTNTAKGFGLGSATGVDLPGEAPGRIVDRARKKADYAELKDAKCQRAVAGYPEVDDPVQAELFRKYAEEYCQDGDQYRVGDAVNAAVGQGDTTLTPLQLVSAYAALGNGGTLYTPHVAKAVVSPTGEVVQTIQPQVRGTLPVSPDVLSYIQNALQGVPTRGTASSAFAGFPLNDIPVAAKTGTAEVAGKETTSVFASYAPADNPRYAVVVAITQAGVGGELSAPAGRKIYDAIFGVKDGKADPARSVLTGGQPQSKLPTLPGAQ